MPDGNYEKHGLSRSSEYAIWAQMKHRCYNPNNPAYKRYGGRGIQVCERWRDSFIAFYKDMGLRPEGLTLERRDNDGNYESSNCKWVTMKEQRRNSRDNRILEFNGKKQCMVVWCEELKLNYKTLQKRLEAGWSVERALTQTMW